MALFVLTTGQAYASDEPVTVTVDRAKVFRIQEPASTVIIGNPFIADVSMHDHFTVVVTGKSYGSTNLVILDDKGEPIIDEVIIVRASEDNVVSVTRNALRQTYSCSPVCEPTLRLGDSQAAFDTFAQQATMRNDLAEKAAGVVK
ncbi:pilus assembly protein N-terminal domain-containing protein [uncultured Roseibium sp.]|uniref:pilus assembly protein N-terminal domain-containing protein n=1 Tax=uncultured Roseibium sp. TaxID=1936171 RepID=UPI003217DD6E